MVHVTVGTVGTHELVAVNGINDLIPCTECGTAIIELTQWVHCFRFLEV
jgi:hypothetical protein